MNSIIEIEFLRRKRTLKS